MPVAMLSTMSLHTDHELGLEERPQAEGSGQAIDPHKELSFRWCLYHFVNRRLNMISYFLNSFFCLPSKKQWNSTPSTCVSIASDSSLQSHSRCQPRRSARGLWCGLWLTRRMTMAVLSHAFLLLQITLLKMQTVMIWPGACQIFVLLYEDDDCCLCMLCLRFTFVCDGKNFAHMSIAFGPSVTHADASSNNTFCTSLPIINVTCRSVECTRK